MLMSACVCASNSNGVVGRCPRPHRYKWLSRSLRSRGSVPSGQSPVPHLLPRIDKPTIATMGGAAVSLRGLLALSGFALSALAGNIRTRQSEGLCETAKYENKTRVFVMTDISNEPDDQMSLVRFLTYANELDIVNIAVVTSTWKNDSIDTPSVYGVFDGYSQVVDSLNSNVPEAGSYPPADEVAAKLVTGHSVYGLAALDEPTPSNASTALIAGVDASEEPLWVLAWGGANVLAEALNQVRNERSEDELAAFVRKLRVHSISDQDDAGAWIRTNFPTLFYIVSIHGFSEYAIATWNVSHATLSPPPPLSPPFRERHC